MQPIYLSYLDMSTESSSSEGREEKAKHEVAKYFKAFTMINGIVSVISADLLLEFMNSWYDFVRG